MARKRLSADSRHVSEKKAVDILSLIHILKENPILWDVGCENYKLTERKPALWRAIAEQEAKLSLG